ncbi:hypothetical protein MLD38_001780 [Melastoma candidum]|uniref:Uncharacterized protein n=1 Tax=Melastoma candidum TaxID=119954 RepID=A0ACB9SDS6_9MYRT|nr:hypothetical protein MLD38_001780 [Melastoma candidum]
MTTREAGAGFAETDDMPPRPKYDPKVSVSSSAILGPIPPSAGEDDDFAHRHSSFSLASPGFYDNGRMSGEGSPMMMSPWNQTGASPFGSSPWSATFDNVIPQNTLIGSLVREEGHIYSLAASGELLYTGSDSKNIRVWKNLKEFAAFKSSSGLVKAIIVVNEKIFTGHQDGKIRKWRVSPKAPSVHKRSGTLPTLKDIFKSSINPSNYIENRRRRSALWIKHSDAVSCLSLDEEHGLLYSASWDRTIKVWRVSDSKCLESIQAHNDAVNSVVVSVDEIVLSGSADGTVKVWKREHAGKSTKHNLAETLLNQECAVTSLAIIKSCSMVYAGSSDGLVNFWEQGGGAKFSHGGVLKGHKLAILCLTAAGSNLVFSGSADKTICVWRRDGTVHTCLSVLTGHTGPVKCLAAEEDTDTTRNNGDHRWILYSGSLDKSVKVWSVSEFAPDVSQMSMMQQPQQMSLDGDSIPSNSSFSSTATGSNSQNRSAKY